MKHTIPEGHHLSPGYRDRLANRFGPEIAEQLDVSGWETMESSFDPSRRISYVQVGEPTKGDIQLVGGFTEGVINQAPLIGALAKEGYRVTMADHGAKGVLRNLTNGKRSALFTRAADSLDVARLHGPKAIVTHSMGSLVLSEMAQAALLTQESTLHDVRAILTAPAGMDDRWSRSLTLAPRFVAKLLSETPGKIKRFSFQDTEGDMFKAGTDNMKPIPRSLMEVWELANGLVDVDKVRESGIARVAILGFGSDPLFNDTAIGERAMKLGLPYSVPVSYRRVGNEVPWRGLNAVHDDGQFHPERVAGAIAAILKAPSYINDPSQFKALDSIPQPRSETAVSGVYGVASVPGSNR